MTKVKRVGGVAQVTEPQLFTITAFCHTVCVSHTHISSSFFFFLVVVLGFELMASYCWAGATPVEPPFQHFCFSYFGEGSHILFPGPAWTVLLLPGLPQGYLGRSPALQVGHTRTEAMMQKVVCVTERRALLGLQSH
jgi:hypothetical protein